MSDTKLPLSERWDLVRGNNLPSTLRHLLLVLQHYQGAKSSVWCRRELLADELGIQADSISHKMKKLEQIGVIRRQWVPRNGRPVREYSIDFNELANHQRTLSAESDCTLSAQSECFASHPERLNRATLSAGAVHPEQALRHEQPRTTIEQPVCPDSKSPDLRTAEFIWKHIHEMQPTRKAPKLNKWADTIRLMRERDGRTDEQIRALFLKCHNDDFERTNVLSPEKLRKRWDNLDLKLNLSKRTNGTGSDFTTVRAKVLQIYSPDVGNTADVEQALTAEQYRAVKAIGLRRVADARGDLRGLAAEYAAALGAGA